MPQKQRPIALKRVRLTRPQLRMLEAMQGNALGKEKALLQNWEIKGLPRIKRIAASLPKDIQHAAVKIFVSCRLTPQAVETLLSLPKKSVERKKVLQIARACMLNHPKFDVRYNAANLAIALKGKVSFPLAKKVLREI